MRVDGVETIVIDLESVTEATSTTKTLSLAGLTPSEREVVVLMLDGASNRDIAEARGSSERTVANQLQSVYRKLGVFSRAELAAALGR